MYEEHEKLKLVKDKSEICGHFLDWLKGERNPQIVLSEDTGNCDVPCFKRTEQLLAEYFEIDLDKLEKEKCQMIEGLR